MVAGGNRQDKSLYEDLRSPAIATSHVLTIAALAAKECRIVKTIDIAGKMTESDVPVYMAIDADMAKVLCQFGPTNIVFLTTRAKY